MLINWVRVLAFVASLNCGHGRLGKSIRHFEALNYELEDKQDKAVRAIRSSLSQEKGLLLVFKAFGRTFRLRLNEDTATVASNAKIHDCLSNRCEGNTLVVGHVDTDEASSAYGWIISDPGFFVGTIRCSDGTYHVDPAEKYFDNANFHSVIYRSQDSGELRINFSQNGSEMGEFSLRASLNRGASINRRKRRALTDRGSPRICSLSLEADDTFLQMATSHIDAIRLMVNHIQALNKMFNNSFDSDDKRSNGNSFALGANDSVVQFRISKIRVYNESESYRVLAPGGLDAATFLRLMQTKGSYSKYCLALFFTARSFNEGVLGIASPRGACMSLNAGVVSFMREGVVLPPLVSEIAVAHVVGHAFGAKHDSADQGCQSRRKDGDFIMTKFGLNADQPNNFLYSPSSLRQINAFVSSLQDKSCLKNDVVLKDSLCGNGVVEDGEDWRPGEECDCGDEKTCRAVEPGNCCDFRTCRLRQRAVCSASNGFCCDPKTCSYKTKDEVCSLETECSESANCSGNSSQCPEASHKEDFLECNWNTSVCISGVCSGKSVCRKFGMKACFCEQKLDECKACCIYESKCQPAQNISKIKSKLKSIYMGPGSLCANRKGYCDVFHKCRPINLNAPFSHRYDPYFRKKGVQEITHQFWWAIFLATVGLIACAVTLMKHVALYTKSSNPELNEHEPAKPLPRLKLSRLKEEEKGIILTEDVIA